MFLDDVRVPAEQTAWARRTTAGASPTSRFSFERGTAFVSELVDAHAGLAERARAVRARPGERRELGHVVAELDALWALTKRNVSQAATTGVPGSAG